MNVLLVEDEIRVADFIRRGLSAEGWSVEHAPDGETGLALLAGGSYDVVLLDLMLPGISGQDLCRKLRARGNTTPILMLSALDATEERVAGLQVGADDYLAKPFEFDELIARVQALHRRATAYGAQVTEVVDGDGIVFDKLAHVTRLDGEVVELSGKEQAVLLLLLANRGRVFSRERILNTVWGVHEDPITNVVDVYVSRLRRKLKAHGSRISTLRNVGYRFD